MNTSKFAGKGRLQFHHLGLRSARCAILFGILGASSWAAAAGGSYAFDKGDSGDSPSWTPDIVTAIDEYVIAPTFNGGRLGLDHFADSNSLDQQGLVTAKLANGDMVVAGLVPDGVSGGSCGDGTKLCKIGLVRYSASGQRITWPNAGINGRFSNNYVVYPSQSTNTLRYQYLRDVNVRGNLIDVLVDYPDSNHTALTLGHRNVYVQTFRDDGSYHSERAAFGAASFGSPGDNEDFYGAQMAQIDSTTMIIAATAYDSVGPYIAVTRLAIDGSGALIVDGGWGTGYAGVNFSRLNRYFGPASFCNVPVSGRCEVTAANVARQEGFATATDFYVGGSLHYSGNDYDVLTLKISSFDGARKAEFGGSGWIRTGFDQVGSTQKDITAGLYVYQDDVYVAAQVAQKCFDGIGLAKLDGANGSRVAAFGTSGIAVFGGQGNISPCFTFSGPDVPFAISATGGRIGIAGYRGFHGLSNTYLVDPMLAVVNAVNGTVLDIDSHPLMRPDGSRFGDAVLFGIYGGPLATSPFTVAGNGRDTTAGNTLSYVSGRLIPVSSDRIFASGFDN
ncbi:MAG: hypothetical protein ABIP56_08845 [Dokdonella sp.]